MQSRSWFRRRIIRIRLVISGIGFRRIIKDCPDIFDVGSEEQLEIVLSYRMLVQKNNQNSSCHLGYWFRRTIRIRPITSDVDSEEQL